MEIMSSCQKCGGGTFEEVAQAVSGAKPNYHVVRCSACHTPVSMFEHPSSNMQIQYLQSMMEKRLRTIEAMLYDVQKELLANRLINRESN